MKTPTTPLVWGLSLALTACAGGSFDTLNVSEPVPIKPDVHKPKPEQSEPSENPPEGGQPQPEAQDKLQQPAFGYGLNGLRRNQAKNGEAGNEHFSPDNVEALPLAEDLSDDNHLVKFAEWENAKDKDEVEYDNHRREGYQYIRFGYLTDLYARPEKDSDGLVNRQGGKVFAYYLGTQPSRSLPNSPSLHYSGSWDFLSNVVFQRAYTKDDVIKEKAEKEAIEKNKQEAVKRNKGYYGPDEPPHFGLAFDKKNDGNVASAYTNARSATFKKQTSDFTVDFNNKKLTGKLSYQNDYRDQADETDRKPDDVYAIEADIKGNRFTGRADSTAGTTKGVNKKVSEDNQNLFGDSASRLEGGFYGPNAEELAGKFLSDHNSVFVVFGAKRDGEAAESSTVLFDAKQIAFPERDDELSDDADNSDDVADNEDAEDTEENSEGVEDSVTEDNAAEDGVAEENDDEAPPVEHTLSKDLNNLGNILQLNIEGKTFDLSGGSLSELLKQSYPQAEVVRNKDSSLDIVLSRNAKGEAGSKIHVCCGNWEALRLGSYRFVSNSEDESISKGYFIQGLRTPLADIPTGGNLHYEGTWGGFAVMTGKRANGKYFYLPYEFTPGIGNEHAGTASFDVDFAAKTLKGSLITSTDENSQTFATIKADIKGNGFSGTADGVYAFDSKNTQGGGGKLEMRGAKVQGGFYGNKAAELGGTLEYQNGHDGSEGTGVRVGAVFGAKQSGK
ncbi:transferrin-binding protein-like solute binding protein [Neisseria sp. ZJ106]|uniref:Transferrin-binding protein B n=1 Tax=Neisseria lisongii TaxID=2912188 RepID=A0ABY7RMD8_9NEIS|nr:transferrin-binding protein-like solute binding protein [Neisseria lisongii]MCF7521663.1 transferrin-binding protein-like solute binding protein [Neisseria lisongii]WCL72250.1 transferrin-binding protein-like solute binding protein [Neisseria lisongii]